MTKAEIAFASTEAGREIGCREYAKTLREAYELLKKADSLYSSYMRVTVETAFSFRCAVTGGKVPSEALQEKAWLEMGHELDDVVKDLEKLSDFSREIVEEEFMTGLDEPPFYSTHYGGDRPRS